MSLLRSLFLGAATAMVLFAVGCSSDKSVPAKASAATTSADSGSSSIKPRIGLVMKSLANEFFATMSAGATAHQAAHSDQYELIVNGIKDERDLSRQVALVEEMVAMKVDAIVIAPADSKALVPALRKAMKEGIVVINIDNRLDADVIAQEQIQIPFVGPDNRAGARQVAEQVAKSLMPGDQVLIIEGLRTSFNAQQRLAGFRDALEAASMKIVDSQSADWEMSTANAIAAAMLSEHPEAKAILAANDSMALGALSAARSAGKEQVLIAGFDNIQAVQEAIRLGKIAATADQHGDQLAVFGIEAALARLANKSAELADVETPVDLITAETLNSVKAK